MPTSNGPVRTLRVAGDTFHDADGREVVLRGVNLGGILLMENAITGFAGVESTMRRRVRERLGGERYELFFDRLIRAMFDHDDARFLRSVGFNCVRIPVNYRHLESDDEPFALLPGAFDHLDRIIGICAEHGLGAVVDLHALPGAQNQHWHSDNPTHLAHLWDQAALQDRAVWLWEQIAEHYKDSAAVAGYNLVNEPADPTRRKAGPLYRRMVEAIRARDPWHVLFLDGNTYATEFDIFDGTIPNAVYTVHDYVEAGFLPDGRYPGPHAGQTVDKAYIERCFLERTEFQRRTGTPVFVGEFGPVHTGIAEADAGRARMLQDQLDVYRRYGASWAFWTYKAVRGQGLVGPGDGTPYVRRFGDFMARKHRFGVDAWASDGTASAEVRRAVKALLREEFPAYAPYPRGQDDWVDTLLLHILLADPLGEQYAELFDGASAADVGELGDSFRLDRCDRRADFVDVFARACGTGDAG
ncbi:glycoside hydrolase family 5 protein [Dactylosporangium sp. CA-092794]|uniref:glycoside hydrolase family 5 protein n=1 Tax=Dactylosporangium sp. CA-092794 TaxID=3239929 RepID=UPI003D943DD6